MHSKENGCSQISAAEVSRQLGRTQQKCKYRQPSNKANQAKNNHKGQGWVKEGMLECTQAIPQKLQQCACNEE